MFDSELHGHVCTPVIVAIVIVSINLHHVSPLSISSEEFHSKDYGEGDDDGSAARGDGNNDHV